MCAFELTRRLGVQHEDVETNLVELDARLSRC